MKRLGVLCLTLGSLLGASGGWARATHPARPQQVKVSVTEAGFVPAAIAVRKGVPIILLVTRKTEKTCAKQAVFPSLGKTFDLPLNKTISVSLPAQDAGRLSFACGMGMLKGEIVVR